jgi:hypothetical protein
MTKRELAISVTVFTEDDTAATKVVEVFARASAGLALDGLRCSLNVGPLEEDDAEPPSD